jgi:hypothetical protein
MGFSPVVNLFALGVAGYLVREMCGGRKVALPRCKRLPMPSAREQRPNIEERRARLFADGPGESS